MSLSKLESLPNEILSDLIEKYINGVDVLLALSYQQNQRFDALINQCHRLHFNFLQCRKDDFSFCMGLLPAYIDKIESLILSEQNTPGQIHAFLSFFPLFTPFKQLHTLYFDFHDEAVDLNKVASAFTSLSETTINALFLSITKTNTPLESMFTNAIISLFNIKSLKRLSLISNDCPVSFDDLLNTSSNIEHLTISNIRCDLSQLQYIGQWAPHLQYLNIEITTNSWADLYNTPKKSSKKTIIPASALRTLVLSIENNRDITLDMLAECFNFMPALTHLEIKTHDELLDANAWKILFETSLPLLTHFNLRTTTSYLNKIDPLILLASFQGSFWIAKKNFYIIITEHERLDFKAIDIYDRRRSNESIFNLPVIKCWIAPDCTVNNNFIIANKIKNLSLSSSDDTLSCHYYFDNVKFLTVNNLNMPLFKWITTYVNCSQIKELIISHLPKKIDELVSLLARMPNINSLRISFDLLHVNKDTFIGKDNHLKYLDISISKHTFDEEDIILIGNLFPYLEHIKINTSSLYNIPIMKIYLLYLRSLTFELEDKDYLYFDDYQRKRWDYELRRKTGFFFRHENNCVTIWIDQAAFEDPYWQTYVVQTPAAFTTSNPIGTSGSNKKKKSILSFFKSSK